MTHLNWKFETGKRQTVPDVRGDPNHHDRWQSLRIALPKMPWDAARAGCFGRSNNQYKPLIMLMEATSGIEPEYTVLQTVA